MKDRLLRVAGILEKGHRAHQSFRVVYVIIAFLSLIGLIIVVELYMFNQRVGAVGI